MPPKQNQTVTPKRERVEKQKRTALAPAVGQPAAGIGVKRAQQRLQRVEQSDDQNARAESFEILRRESKPEPFAGERQYQRPKQQRGVSSQRKKPRDRQPGVHGRLRTPT